MKRFFLSVCLVFFIPVFAQSYSVDISIQSDLSSQYVGSGTTISGSFDLSDYVDVWAADGKDFSVISGSSTFNFIDDGYDLHYVNTVYGSYKQVYYGGGFWGTVSNAFEGAVLDTLLNPLTYLDFSGSSVLSSIVQATVVDSILAGLDGDDDNRGYERKATANYYDDIDNAQISYFGSENLSYSSSSYQRNSFLGTHKDKRKWYCATDTFLGCIDGGYKTYWTNLYRSETGYKGSFGGTESLSSETIDTLNSINFLNFYISPGSFSDFSFLSASLDLTVELFDAVIGDDETPAPVPEPSTWVLLGTGLAGLAYYRRKKS